MGKLPLSKMFSDSHIQFAKYLFVGGINFLFGLATYFICLRVLHLYYLVAFSLSWLIGVLLTYIINFVWIFKLQEKLNFKARLAKYVSIYIVSYLANVALLKLLTQLTHGDPFFLQFGIIPVVMLINFSGMKYWALK
jgi:putative flippase GtrA